MSTTQISPICNTNPELLRVLRPKSNKTEDVEEEEEFGYLQCWPSSKRGHPNLSLECLLECLRRFDKSVALYGHSGHGNGLSPVWVRKCTQRLPFHRKVFPQTSHAKSFCWEETLCGCWRSFWRRLRASPGLVPTKKVGDANCNNNNSEIGLHNFFVAPLQYFLVTRHPTKGSELKRLKYVQGSFWEFFYYYFGRNLLKFCEYLFCRQKHFASLQSSPEATLLFLRDLIRMPKDSFFRVLS